MTIDELSEYLADLNQQIKDNNLNWEAGLTSLSHLTLEEFQQRLGSKSRGIEKPGKELDDTALPGTVDWNIEQYVFPVENQGQCDSCVGFATSQCVASNALIEREHPITGITTIVDYMLSPAPPYFCTGGDCEQGMYIDDALDYIKDKGDELLINAPYYPNPLINKITYEGLCPTLPGNETVAQISKYVTKSAANQVKAWLAQEGTMIAQMEVYQSFMHYPNLPNIVYSPLPGEPIIGYHAVHLVGYSDPLQAWICQNSWGTGWGLEGYFYIAYGTCGIGTMYALYGIDGFTKNPVPRLGV